MNTKLTKIISGLFVATAAFQTASAGNITDIKVSSLPNKQKIVKVSFDKEIVNPTGFVTSSPAASPWTLNKPAFPWINRYSNMPILC